MTLAEQILERAVRQGFMCATAESCTGGMVSAAIDRYRRIICGVRAWLRDLYQRRQDRPFGRQRTQRWPPMARSRKRSRMKWPLVRWPGPKQTSLSRSRASRARVDRNSNQKDASVSVWPQRKRSRPKRWSLGHLVARRSGPRRGITLLHCCLARFSRKDQPPGVQRRGRYVAWPR